MNLVCKYYIYFISICRKVCPIYGRVCYCQHLHTKLQNKGCKINGFCNRYKDAAAKALLYVVIFILPNISYLADKNKNREYELRGVEM